MSELKLPELFGSRVFNEETMKERLSGKRTGTETTMTDDGTPSEDR